MNNIMVDLETLGTSSDAVIIAIGAVAFDATGLGQTFYITVDPQSCVDLGMKIDAATVMWWMRQSDAARGAFSRQGTPIVGALDAFSRYVAGCAGASAEVWGNGATFDNVILANAYRAANMLKPWAYWGDRCYRTMKSMYPHIAVEKAGVMHNALDDAAYQATHMVKLLKHMRGDNA